MTDNDKQIEEDLKNVGERLALLLASADMPDDVKDAWAALIPEMSLEQIDRFAKALESNIAVQGSEEMKQFAGSIETIKQKSAEAQKASQDKAMASFDEIEQALDQGGQE